MRDVLLHLHCHPDPTSGAVVDRAVALAGVLGAGITAVGFDLEFKVRRTLFSDLLLDVEALAARERARCREAARDLVARFEDQAAARGLVYHALIERCLPAEVADVLVARARLCDLAIVPVAPAETYEHFLAEAVVFGAGRPVLVLPDDGASTGAAPPARPVSLDRIGVAFDFGRAAARALHDAMPLLARAKAAKVVVVTGDKPQTRFAGIADLEHHLARHGIDAVIEEHAADGRPAAEVIAEFALEQDLDLLVAGAWGHSRLREFVLGGVTRSLLQRPPLPLLMSH